jgi:hypothetical protein
MSRIGAIRIALSLTTLSLITLSSIAAAWTIPAWLHPYPGANEEITTSPGRVVVTYETSLSLEEIVAFQRGLFAAQSIPFQPEMYGTAAVIRANPEGCGLTIQIRQEKSGTAVQITATERPVIPRLTESDIRRSMEKYDQPVYPAPKVPLPALIWPSWLAAYGVEASPVRKGVDQFRNQYLVSEFDSTEARGAIQAFYSGLLNAHEYRVTMESSPITPPAKPAVVEGMHSFELSGRFVIRVDLSPPTARGVHVDIRITAHR